MTIIDRLGDLFGRRRKASRAEAESIVQELIVLGYLRFAPETHHARIRESLIANVQSRYLDSDRDDDGRSLDLRIYATDAEDLAEGQVGACLLSMRQALSVEGVSLSRIEDDFADRTYRVRIEGIAHTIYDEDDDPEGFIWPHSHLRLIEIVDGLLDAVSSRERAFGIYFGSEEAQVMLLTPAMHDCLRAHAAFFDASWMPKSADELRSILSNYL